MTHRETYGDKPCRSRRKYADNMYLEIIDVRIKNGRIECLSRWNKYNCDGILCASFGYRWRKVCGKDIYIKALKRPAIDDHDWSLAIRNPSTGKMNRAYLRDFESE